jgi:hypothetical protein
MATVDLSGWKEDLDAAAVLLPAQRSALLTAYHTAVTSGGKSPGDTAGLTAYLTAAGIGGGRANVTRFLTELHRMTNAGEIPYPVYDPSKGALATIGRGIAETSSAAAQAATGGLTRIAIIAGIALAGYLIVTGQLRLPRGKD